MRSVTIAGRDVTDGHRPYVIAELSCNHRGSYETAADTVRAAAQTGADAIKLQTYTADTLTLDSDAPHFVIGGGTLWDGRTLHDLYSEAYTPWEWQPRLIALARELGLDCFSSPFDETAVDFLDELDVPAFKIASFEITDVNLIEYAASKGRPMIISTGIAEPADIDAALDACGRAGNDQVVLLKCTSAYPAPFDEMNVRTIPDMARRWDVPVGLSDHSPGSAVAVAATALGAVIVEKHLILDRALGGPDAEFSMDPAEFRSLVTDVHAAHAALGEVTYDLSAKQQASRAFARSLFVAQDVAQGEELTRDNVRSVRPGFGAHPRHLGEVLGRRAARDLAKGEPFDLDMADR